MRDALSLAIGSGMKFNVGDFTEIDDAFHAGRWIGTGDDNSEWCYRLAVLVGNKSAIDAYESYRHRKPFIADDVEPGDRYDHGGYLHLSGKRQRERLAIGFIFPWKGERVTVTSMPVGNKPIIACSYRDTGNHYDRKVLHRYKITAADITAARAERKERAQILDRARALPDSGVFIAKLGVTTQAELDRVPLAKMRKAIDEVAA